MKQTQTNSLRYIATVMKREKLLDSPFQIERIGLAQGLRISDFRLLIGKAKGRKAQ